MAMAVAEPSYAAEGLRAGASGCGCRRSSTPRPTRASVTVESLNAALFGERARGPAGRRLDRDRRGRVARRRGRVRGVVPASGDRRRWSWPATSRRRTRRTLAERALGRWTRQPGLDGGARGQPGESPAAAAAGRLAGCAAGHRAAGRPGDHPRRPTLAGDVRRQLRRRRQLRLAAQHRAARAEGPDVRRQLGPRQRADRRAAWGSAPACECCGPPRRSARSWRSCGTPPAP